MKKIRIVSFMLVALLFLGSINIFALTRAEFEQRKKKNEELIKSKKSENAENAQNIAAAQKELNKIEAAIEQQEQRIAELTANIIATEGLITETEEEIEQIQNRLSLKEKLLAERIKAIYMQGDIGYISILLNSKDIHSYLSNKSLVTFLVKQDRELIEYIAEGKETVERKKEELLILNNDLNLSRQEVEQAKAESEKAKRDKEQFIAQTQADIQKNLQWIEKAAADSVAMEKQILAAEAAQRSKGNIQTDYTGGGKLGWPVPGYARISSPFGNRILFGRREFHSGIDIPAPMGTPVVAAESGVVTMATTAGSYGKIVVVQHKPGLATAYAHNSKMIVSPGEYVKKGQTIALIGSTGFSTGPHCHFEVRQGGKATNPINWLR